MTTSYSGKLLFIGGVHGSGKTTIGRMASSRIGAKFYSCSQLIRTERQTQAVSTVSADDVAVNQLALIAGLTRLRASMETVIIDGHFTLRTQVDGIQAIPHTVFEAMRPDYLFLTEATSSSIRSRLSNRDGVVISESSIVEHQEQERRFAVEVSRHLGIPLVILNGDDDKVYLLINVS